MDSSVAQNLYSIFYIYTSDVRWSHVENLKYRLNPLEQIQVDRAYDELVSALAAGNKLKDCGSDILDHYVAETPADLPHHDDPKSVAAGDAYHSNLDHYTLELLEKTLKKGSDTAQISSFESSYSRTGRGEIEKAVQFFNECASAGENKNDCLARLYYIDEVPPPPPEPLRASLTIYYGGEASAALYNQGSLSAFSPAGVAYFQLGATLPANQHFGVNLNAKIMGGGNGNAAGSSLGGNFDRWAVYLSRMNLIPNHLGITKANVELCFYDQGLKFFGGISPNEDTGLPYNFNGYTLPDGTFVNTLQENVNDNTSGANMYPLVIGPVIGLRWDSPQLPGFNITAQTGPDGGFKPTGPWTNTLKLEFDPNKTQIAVMGTVQADPENPETVKQGAAAYLGQNAGPLQLGVGYGLNALHSPGAEPVVTHGLNTAINLGLPGDFAVWSAGYSLLIVDGTAEHLLEPTVLTFRILPGVALRTGGIINIVPNGDNQYFISAGLGINEAATFPK